ncbi:glycosyltransferase [Sphingobium limneticum]|nr:glycosyltransferase [Sphingobium limneticum]
MIIPHFNDLRSLDLCLASLASQTQPRDTFEVIVADNCSPVAPHELEAVTAGRASYVRVEQRGAAIARNEGVRVSKGRILAFIDCDCIAEPEWLSEGVTALRGQDLVGGEMKVLVDRQRSISGAEAFESVFAFDNRRYVEQESFTVTANLFTSRSTFERVGGFCNGVSEDKEWCHRARDLGFRIGYARNARVGHPARENWADLRRKWERLNIETFALFRMRRFGRMQWLLRSWILLPSIFGHLPAVLKSRALQTSAERRAAIVTLARIRSWRFIHAHRLLMQKD